MFRTKLDKSKNKEFYDIIEESKRMHNCGNCWKHSNTHLFVSKKLITMANYTILTLILLVVVIGGLAIQNYLELKVTKRLFTEDRYIMNYEEYDRGDENPEDVEKRIEEKIENEIQKETKKQLGK